MPPWIVWVRSAGNWTSKPQVESREIFMGFSLPVDLRWHYKWISIILRIIISWPEGDELQSGPDTYTERPFLASFLFYTTIAKSVFPRMNSL